MEKDNNMKNRFIELYELDFTDENHYDLVVNTNEMNIEEIVAAIISKYSKWSAQ